VQLAYKLAPDNDPAVLEFALATSLHHDGITGMSMMCRGYGVGKQRSATCLHQTATLCKVLKAQ
jgi:hypothetical protein